MTNKELMTLAKDAREKAYAPYSNFKVGAAVLCENGEVYTGCNIENACGTSCCAERVAVHTAVAAGMCAFKAIAIAGEHEDVFPCGICRQVLMEFSPDMTVVIGNGKEYKASGLLPNNFRR